MILKINKSITLSTGGTSSATIVELFNDPIIPKGDICQADIRVWRNLADKDSGLDHTYLLDSDSNRMTNISHEVDTSSVNSDGHYGSIATTHTQDMIDVLAERLGLESADIELVELIKQ